MSDNGYSRLVFTDLDGSLLGHHDYSFQDALGQLRVLERAGIPLIPATSKTRAEIEQLRAELGNAHPFIVENGAAVFIPRGYFSTQPAATRLVDDYWVRELSAGREHWLQLLAGLYPDYFEEFDYFHHAGTAGIVAMTGLDEAAAQRANQRAYSEPVKWLGDSQRRASFVAELVAAGATVLQGGRFMSVAGDCDKGRALTWLQAQYQRQSGGRVLETLAIGDSANDCAMLEVADTALLVRSPVHEYPPLKRADGVLRSRDYGPAGWAEGVARWLHSATRE